MVSTEKEILLDAVEILLEQEKEQHALAVLKVAIEKSLKHILGVSDQTIRRMCERGKFKGASRAGGDGHWRIPEENFITTSEQDKKAERILQQIDKKNVEARGC